MEHGLGCVGEAKQVWKISKKEFTRIIDMGIIESLMSLDSMRKSNTVQQSDGQCNE